LFSGELVKLLAGYVTLERLGGTIRNAYGDLRVECPRPPLGDITTLMPQKAKPPRLARGFCCADQ
jgi:hypothetical protein